MDRAINVGFCGFILGLLCMDMQADHYALEGHPDLSSSVAYYRLLALQPIPYSLITPVMIALFLVQIIKTMVTHKRKADFATFGLLLVSLSLFAGVVLPNRSTLLTQKTSQQDPLFRMALAHVAILPLIVIVICLQLNALSSPQDKKKHQ